MRRIVTNCREFRPILAAIVTEKVAFFDQLSAGKNKYLVPTGTNVTLDVGGPKMTLADAQAKGVDAGSTVGDTPTDEEILSMGKALLGAQ